MAAKLRKLVGCVPYRKNGDGIYEILLVLNTKEEEWILPKGGWEKKETASVGAARETWEEAGVSGRVTALGEWDCISRGRPGICSYFAMDVEKVWNEYPEKNRRRKWVSFDEALHECKRPEMQAAMKACMDRLRLIL